MSARTTTGRQGTCQATVKPVPRVEILDSWDWSSPKPRWSGRISLPQRSDCAPGSQACGLLRPFPAHSYHHRQDPWAELPEVPVEL